MRGFDEKKGYFGFQSTAMKESPEKQAAELVIRGGGLQKVNLETLPGSHI